jgi:hypothetical protein
MRHTNLNLCQFAFGTYFQQPGDKNSMIWQVSQGLIANLAICFGSIFLFYSIRPHRLSFAAP